MARDRDKYQTDLEEAAKKFPGELARLKVVNFGKTFRIDGQRHKDEGTDKWIHVGVIVIGDTPEEDIATAPHFFLEPGGIMSNILEAVKFSGTSKTE